MDNIEIHFKKLLLAREYEVPYFSGIQYFPENQYEHISK